MPLKNNLFWILICIAPPVVTQAQMQPSDPNSTVTQVPGGRYQLPPVAIPESADTANTDGSKPIMVRQIAFRGNKVLRTSALQVVAAEYLNKQLSAADIEELRIALTRQYTDRGYINSGVILDPNAPYHDGKLSFVAIEGHIKDVRVHGLKHLRAAYAVERLRASSDEVLNTNQLRERFQGLLDDPLFTRINSRIEPGAELGEAILDVDIERAKPYSMSVASNNYRPPSIGEKAYDVAGALRDLTGWGDVIDADVTGPIEFSGGVGYSVDWQVPLNHYGSLIAISAARSQTVITEEPLAPLDIRSKIDRAELRFTQPLVATRSQQFKIGVGVSRETDATTLAEEAFSFLPGADNGVTRSNTVRVAPDYSYRSEHQYFGVRITWLHAALLDQSTQPVAYSQPAPRYQVWTGQIHYLLEFSPLPFEFEPRATIQHTGAIISDLHELEIGGINSVRGFREDEILLSNAKILNFDLRWLALPAGNSIRPGLTLGTFFDWAKGYNIGEPTDKSTFSSCGVTGRAKWRHVQADLAYGIPLIKPEFVSQQHGSWQDHGIHAQIAMTF
jgi:hemolysin activation/secretion protein